MIDAAWLIVRSEQTVIAIVNKILYLIYRLQLLAITFLINKYFVLN